MSRVFAKGDRVVKDPSGWRPSDFDRWRSGEGVGVVVAVLRDPGPSSIGGVDVRWPTGRSWHHAEELLPAPDDPDQVADTGGVAG